MRRGEAAAKPYARALFLMAREHGLEETAGQELEAARASLFAHPELVDVLRRPWIKGETKQAMIASVAEQARWSPLVKDFLGLLAMRGRLDHLPEIVSVYRQFVDELRGRVRAEVRCSVPLAESEREALSQGLSRVVGKEVLVEETADATLLGGFVAQIGSLVLDGSLSGQLARLRERLVRG